MAMLLVLLAIGGIFPVGLAVDPVAIVPGYSLEIKVFNPTPTLTNTGDALYHVGHLELTSSGPKVVFCKKRICAGKTYYGESAKIPSGKSISFNTKFIFSMKGAREQQVAGDGLVFFVTQHPAFQGVTNGQFGLFTSAEDLAQANLAFGIEFDTLKNSEFGDIDDNHVGINIGSAVSKVSVSATSAGVILNSGQKIVAWIDYYKPQNVTEVRINYLSDSSKPLSALISFPFNFNSLNFANEVWFGFAASTNFGFEQTHKLWSWELTATFPDGGLKAVSGLEEITWTRTFAYTIAGAIACGILWWLIVRYTACGKRNNAKLMTKIAPWGERIKGKFPRGCKKRIPASCMTFEDDEDEDEDDEAPKKKSVKKTSPPKPVKKRAPPPPADDDEGDDDEEEDAPPKKLPPKTPNKKKAPPPPPDDEEDDNDDDPDPPPPPPPPPYSGGRGFYSPPPPNYPPPPPSYY